MDIITKNEAVKSFIDNLALDPKKEKMVFIEWGDVSEIISTDEMLMRYVEAFNWHEEKMSRWRRLHEKIIRHIINALRLHSRRLDIEVDNDDVIISLPEYV